MVRSHLLLAVVAVACGRSGVPPVAQSKSVPVPVESRPVRLPWVGAALSGGAGHLEGGGVRTSARVSTLQALLPDNEWFDALEPDSVVTATLARPIDGALHHRLSGVLRADMSWPDARSAPAACPPVGPLGCVAFPWGKAYVRIEDRALTVDLITHGEATDQGVLAASSATAHTAAAPKLAGDLVMQFDNAVLASALQHKHVPAFDHASIELTQSPSKLRTRLRWTPPSTWSPRHSTAPAPSWDALCSGALACARTGPWPDIHAWLQSVGTAEPPQGSGLTTLSLWSSTWPHELAAWVATLRDRSPEISWGFIDMALGGLSEIEFAGARLDEGGVFIAFVRIPAAWVNLTASVLPYAGLQPTAEPAGNTTVTWAPLQQGGIALALDDGPEPTMGWIVLASSLERFAWLMDTPRTRAQSSALTARIARIDRVTEHAPQAWRAWLAVFGDHTATLRVEVEEGRLSVSADLEARGQELR